MLHINFYTKENCQLCDEAIAILESFKTQYPYILEKRDITYHKDWLNKYQFVIPVIEIDGEQLHAGQISYDSIKTFLEDTSNP